MNILLLGHKGMLGSELFGRLSVHHEVIGKDMDDFDIASAESCQHLISEAGPDVVMNAAAYTDVDGCESNRDTCFAVNAEGTKNVALACRDRNIKIVHFSTDYVFDGTRKGPYREEDDCHPLNVYGQSKWMGERHLQQFSENYILVRTAWLYGKNGKNFVKTVLNKARMEKKLEVVDDQIGSPTYTKDLATAVQYLLENNYTGVFHITNRGSCSWYEFAVQHRHAAQGLDEAALKVRREAARGRAAQPAGNQQGKNDHREGGRGVAQEEHESLDQRHLDEDVAGADKQEVEQEFQHAGVARQARAQHQRRQKQNQQRGDDGNQRQPEQQRHRFVDLVIRRIVRRRFQEYEQVARLHGVKEEGPVVGNGADVEDEVLFEAGRVGVMALL